MAETGEEVMEPIPLIDVNIRVNILGRHRTVCPKCHREVSVVYRGEQPPRLSRHAPQTRTYRRPSGRSEPCPFSNRQVLPHLNEPA